MNTYEEVMIDTNLSNSNTLKVKLEKRYIKNINMVTFGDTVHSLVTIEEVFMDFKQIQVILSKYNLSIEEMKLSGYIALSKDSLEIADKICWIKLIK